MSCDVGEVTESFTYVTAHSPTLPLLHLRHSSLSNPSFAFTTSQDFHLRELCSFSKLSVASPTSQLILQPFPRFTHVTAYSPTLPLLHLRHSSFSNPSFAFNTSQDFHLREMCSFSKLSVASPTSQLILQDFPRFTYVTAHSSTLQLLHLRHSSFSNPSFAFTTSEDFHLCHLASRPWLSGRHYLANVKIVRMQDFFSGTI